MALSLRVRKTILLSLLVLVGVSLIGFVAWFFYFFSSGLFQAEQPIQKTDPVALARLDSATNGIEEEIVEVVEEDMYSSALEPTPSNFEPEVVAPSVARFLIEGFPTRVEQGVAISFEVTPVDIDGNPVEFDGSIRFTASDDQAILPEDYNFQNSVGEKIFFDSGVAFEDLGVQSIQVTSVDDTSVSGEILVAVVPSKKPIEILLPQPGETSDLQVVIRGETQQGIHTVDIYDGGQRIGQNVKVSDDGNFMFVTGFLTPGMHKLKVVDARDNTVVSDVVELKVARNQ